MTRVFDKDKIGEKNFFINIERPNEIAQKFGYVVEFKCGVLIVRQNEPDFYKTEIIVKSDYNDNNEYVVERFAVEFVGFGSCEADKENNIFAGILRAKNCVEALNSYLNNEFLI